MNPRDELKAYVEAMGAEALFRQYERDGRDMDGTCPECRAVAYQAHRRNCTRKPAPLAPKAKA